MATQHLPTMRQFMTVRGNGQTEFVTHDAVIQPGQHAFASERDLDAYLSETLGGKTENGGVHGLLSCKGKYTRRSANGSQAVTFGDPGLDAVASANGTLVIGDRTIDLSKGRASSNFLHRTSRAGNGIVALDAPSGLMMTGIVHDAERWATSDGSYVEYRIHNGRLGFHAWKENYTVFGYGYWSMGLEISVWDTATKFEAARITSVDYMTVNAPCQMFGHDPTDDFNDDYLDQMDWGIHAQQPERVAGICQAQWHHRQFVDLVTAGGGCDRYKTDTWPTTFPVDWTPIVTAIDLNGAWTDGSSRSADITVTRRSFSIDMSAFGRPTAHGTVSGFTSITATFPDDRTYTGQLTAPKTITWSNGSTWTKVVNTAFDLNGNWTDGSPWIAVIHEGASAITVDMSDFDRPTAHGSIVDGSTIKVTFPDDQTYTGTLIAPNRIRWSNGSFWTKKS